MRLDSVRSRDQSPESSIPPIEVVDCFEIKADYGLPHAAGLVAVLRDFKPSEGESLVGRSVTIHTPDGRTFHATVAETRDHGPTISLFFEGMNPEDLPVDSEIALDG